MHLFPIAVAGIIFLTGELEPICSICFLGSAASRTKKDAVESYISHMILHKLAAIAPSVNEGEMNEFINISRRGNPLLLSGGRSALTPVIRCSV